MVEGPQGLPNETKSLSSTMPTLPPGPRFLLQHIHYISLPPASVFLGNILAQRLGDVNLPTFAIALAYLLSFPIFWFGYRIWRDLSVKRAAAARGAIVLPLAKLTKDIKFTEEERYPRRSSPGNLILAYVPLTSSYQAIFSSDFARYGGILSCLSFILSKGQATHSKSCDIH